MLPSHHIKNATALVLALGAIVPAAASAKPIGPDPTPFSRSRPRSSSVAPRRRL